MIDLHSFFCTLGILFYVFLFLGYNEPLNNKKMFTFFYCYSIISLILFFAFDVSLGTHNEKAFHWVLPVPIFVLTLYKLMDNYIIKKFKRHIIFYYKAWGKDNYSWREVVFQMALMWSILFYFFYWLF